MNIKKENVANQMQSRYAAPIFEAFEDPPHLDMRIKLDERRQTTSALLPPTMYRSHRPLATHSAPPGSSSQPESAGLLATCLTCHESGQMFCSSKSVFCRNCNRTALTRVDEMMHPKGAELGM